MISSVANATIERTDRFRADYYKYYTHGNYWTNPVNYDLTLNSERVGIENCVKTIEQRNRTIHSRMREYLYELKHHELLTTSIIPLGDGVAVSVKKQEGE